MKTFGRILIFLIALGFVLILAGCSNSIAGFTDGAGGKYFVQTGSALTRSKASREQSANLTITKPNGDVITLSSQAKGETDESRVPVMAGYMAGAETVLKSAPSIAKAVKP